MLAHRNTETRREITWHFFRKVEVLNFKSIRLFACCCILLAFQEKQDDKILKEGYPLETQKQLRKRNKKY